MGWTAAKNKARIGYDYIHSAVNDHSRLAYSEIHADEHGDTAAGFIQRAAEFFVGHGIKSIKRLMTYNHHRPHHALGGHPPITRCHQPEC